MLYEEARVYLDQVSKYGSVLGLESIRDLLEELGNPQERLQFIHIAGTNGKGSTLASLSTVLKAAGYRTGCYISPTVMDYLERFQINGTYIEKDLFAELTEKVKQASERMIANGKSSPTVFEMETAIAMLYFESQKCDIVVLETGMGGLLDATNIVSNVKACVFVSISKDHVGVLGNSLQEIAANKAGIIKKGAVVISVPQRPEVMQILKETAVRHQTHVTVSEPDQIIEIENTKNGQIISYKWQKELCLPLLGKYQQENATVVLETIHKLNEMGMHISQEAVSDGIKATFWPGRFQIVSQEPLVIVDGAHNEAAAVRLAENLEFYLKGESVTAVMGVFKDKAYDEIIRIMKPYMKKVYAIDLPNKERTLEKEALVTTLKNHQIPAEATESVEEALRNAKMEGGPVLVFGSLSYLGDVIRLEERKVNHG